MATGKPLGAKLFLEGIEVPLIGATVTYTVGQAAIAYIDVVPQKEIKNIKPRTHVALFARDYNAPGTSGNLNFPHVLAFEGEVFGYNFGKQSSGRTFTISAIDYSNYWDNVLAYFFNAQQSLSKGAGIVDTALNRQDNERLGNAQINTTHSASSYFLNILRETLKTDGADFLDGLTEIYKKIGNLNEFYRLSEDRLRIIERILLNSSGNLTQLLEEQEALDWFGGVIGRRSGFSTLRSVVQTLMSIIFHDFVSVPFPAKVPFSNLTGEPVQFTGDAVRRTIGNFIFKPNLYMTTPPACNVFYPDEYSSFQFNRNFLQEPTRLIYKPEMPFFGQAGSVALPHVYEPESFDFFMRKKGAYPEELIGDGALQTDRDRAHFGDPDSDERSKLTNQGNLREAQFLTNEELMKGPLLSQETMVPASSSYRASLSEAGRQEHSQQIAKYLFFKKRFQGRQIQITSHLKLSVVPGFPVLVLDDSEADQSVVAYCSSVTHRFYATQGGYTNVQLSYARTVDEQDVASGNSNEPLIPPWFDPAVFGEKTTPPESKAAKNEVREGGEQIVYPEALSNFYAGLLGEKGSSTINTLAGEATLLGAARFMLNEYRSVREKNSQAVTQLIARRTGRDYVTLRQAFKFLGSGTSRRDLDTTQFVQFFGDRLEGKADGGSTADRAQIDNRRSVVLRYRDALKANRGFRG
jgi:hypothetical protein